MPEDRTRGRTGRRLALALIVPAATVAAIFTAAGMATGTTTVPEAAATTPSGTATTSPSTTRSGTATPSGSPSATVPGLPGVPVPGVSSAVSCLRGTTTTSPAPGLSPSGTATVPVPGVPTTGTATPTLPRVPGGTVPTAPGTGGVTAVPGAATTTGGATVPGTTSSSHATTAPTAAPTTVRIGTAGGKSNVLVDQNGCALYMSTKDTSTTTGVDAAGEALFPPITAPGQPGTGVQAKDLGTFQRPDGKNQVTFMGHQLYRFVDDTAPGQANGEGRNGTWFLVGQNGEPVK